MSPRRRFAPGEGSLLVARPVPPPRPWGLPVAAGVAAVLIVAAIAACTLMLISNQSRVRTASKERQVLSYVTGFMVQFTSIDPYHANDYVTRVLAQATGDFAKQYQEKANEILLQVARAEPATGRMIKDGNFENLNDWNVVEVIWQGDRAAHIVNGRTVNTISKLQQPDPQNPGKFIPLTRGKIAIEIEFAEIWFRRIEVKSLV